MKRSPARRIAILGMLFALAMVLSWFESLVSPLLGLPPGVKLGLANVVVMFALLFLPVENAAMLVVLKGGFAFLTRGGTAAIMSLSGSLLALLVMFVLLNLPAKPSMVLFSVTGSLFHNLGQLICIRFLLGGFALYYGPVLAVSGIVMGFLTAVLLRTLLPALREAGVATQA